MGQKKVMLKPALFTLLMAVLILPVAAQNKLPQEYTTADEIITLSADMSFEQAFIILSKISIAKEGKIIIDPAKRQGRIDVDIVNLPWKKAFEVILKAHRLKYVEHEKFYEVVGDVEQVSEDKTKVTMTSREVRIEAIFFEGDRHALAESGVDWSFLRSGNTMSGGFTVNGASSVSSDIVEGNLSYSTNSGGIDYTVSGMFKAFESQNLGRILAQPYIVVLSGREGRIQVGQDFSIKTRDFAGNIIDNFFSTGTILTVIPTTFSENGVNYVHLKIHAERSNALPDAVSTTINKSQADTQVLLLDGESTMVGGLYNREYKSVRKGVPYLKDLPWWVFGLRYLFGYDLKDGTDKELMVLLKASIIPDLKTRAGTSLKSLNEVFDKDQENYQNKMQQNWDSTDDFKNR
jgi:general secretion pathway protein D